MKRYSSTTESAINERKMAKITFIIIMTVVALIVLSAFSIATICSIQENNSAYEISYKTEIIDTWTNPDSYFPIAYIKYVDNFGKQTVKQITMPEYEEFKQHIGETVSVNSVIAYNFVEGEHATSQYFTY